MWWKITWCIHNTNYHHQFALFKWIFDYTMFFFLFHARNTESVREKCANYKIIGYQKPLNYCYLRCSFEREKKKRQEILKDIYLNVDISDGFFFLCQIGSLTFLCESQCNRSNVICNLTTRHDEVWMYVLLLFFFVRFLSLFF